MVWCSTWGHWTEWCPFLYMQSWQVLECVTMNGLPCDGQAPLDACLYMEGPQQSSTHKLLHSVTLYFSRSIDQEPQWFASQLTPCTLLIVYNYKHPLRTHTPRLAGAAIVPVIHCSPLCAGMREGGVPWHIGLMSMHSPHTHVHGSVNSWHCVSRCLLLWHLFRGVYNMFA